MRRRTFLKRAGMATMASPLAWSSAPGIARAAQAKRIAFGGIQIECSTYSRILSRMEDFEVLRGQALADDHFFSLLKSYPYAFQPTLLAAAVPGGPVDRKTYDELKSEFLHR